MSATRPFRVRARQLLTFGGAAVLPVLDTSVLAARDDAAVGLINDGCVEVREDGRVSWVGRWDNRGPDALPVIEVPVAMPGWIDCHTHALHAGDRAADFARRNAGVSYQEILSAGGGISSTLAQTRGASDKELVDSLVARLTRMHAAGCAVIEVKSGYGLSIVHELRHLALIREADMRVPAVVVSTCLAGHMIPPERVADRTRYIDIIVDKILPAVAAGGLADQVDVFCDSGALTVQESRRILTRGRDLGLHRRIHAEQLSNTGAAQLAAEVQARSADHLEHIDDVGIAAMKDADVAAVLLPLCTAFLDMQHRPPARALLDAGVRVAVATDYNPGSANSSSLHLAMSLACSLYKLTPGEALRGVTRVAAEVLGVDDRFGRIADGTSGQLIGFDVSDWRQIPWHMTADACPPTWLSAP